MQQRWQLRSAKLAVAAALLCLLCPAAFAHKDVEPKDQAEAFKWMEEALSSFKNVKVTDQYVLYSSAEANFGIALPRLSQIAFVNTRKYPYAFCTNWRDYAHDAPDHICWIYKKHKEAERFAAALEYLSVAAWQQVKAQYDAHYQQFEAQLKPWRDAAAKPAMPEAAREHQVLAEYAFKEKDEEKAIREYMAALDIFPTWPEGQFNLATLAGEKKYYELAVLHMKEYLELVPDSPDAQAAKDSIIIWRDKLSTLMAQEDSAPAQQQQGKGSLVNTAVKSTKY